MSSGELTKLIIECYADETYDSKSGDDFVAMFNPNKYSSHYEIEYGESQAAGTAADAPSFSNMKPQELALEFFLDGTGVTTGTAEDVQTKVDDFLSKAYQYDGELHRNRYLRVVWSSLVFDCVLKSADVNYNLFNASGKPLRAKINAKFLGFVNDELRERRQDPRSPDLTHVREIKGRQRIDTLTHKIYKSPDYYIDVAKSNKLLGFRKLRSGNTLVFPPLVKGDT